jgi:hypothetical protein
MLQFDDDLPNFHEIIIDFAAHRSLGVALTA